MRQTVSAAKWRKQGQRWFLAVLRPDLHSESMRRTRWLLLWLGMLAGCAGPSVPSAADMLVAGSNDAAPRLVIEGDRVVRATIPTDFLSLPQAVREAAEAVLEGGQLSVLVDDVRRPWR